MCQRFEGRPFPSNKELLAHVVTAHQRRICTICLQVGGLPGLQSPAPSFMTIARSPSFPQRLTKLFIVTMASFFQQHCACDDLMWQLLKACGCMSFG